MLTRTAMTATAALLAVVSTAAPAQAADGWGHAHCGQEPTPGCELVAGTDPVGEHQPTPADPTLGGNAIGEPLTVDCSYVPLNPDAPSRPDPETGKLGRWYVYRCGDDRPEKLRPVKWIADGDNPNEPAALPSPAQLGEQARNRLRLPSPHILSSPAGDQLVNLPTWMWVDRGGWGDLSATATVPGVSVTAVATPISIVWSMGDGASVMCTGPGTPYRAGEDPKASSPDCGHTYRTSSAHQAGQAFPVSATVRWAVRWSGAGQAGVFPDMTTTGSAALRVAESHALNTGDG